MPVIKNAEVEYENGDKLLLIASNGWVVDGVIKERIQITYAEKIKNNFDGSPKKDDDYYFTCTGTQMFDVIDHVLVYEMFVKRSQSEHPETPIFLSI